MFFRQKRSGRHVYLQIVENRWEKGRTRQRVAATVGRLDQLRQSGQLDSRLQSGAKFAQAVMMRSAHRPGEVLNKVKTRRCQAWEEAFDFLGYTIGKCYSPKTGRA